MFRAQYLTEITILVTSDTPLTPSILDQTLMELDRSITTQTGGLILSGSYNCSQLEALH
jgi:hypothetical protein